MSLGQKTGGSLKFLRLKEGAIFLPDGTTPYQYIDGVVTDIRFKMDEFEGKKVESMNVNIKSVDGNTYVFSVRVENWRHFSALAGGLIPADITRPLRINVGKEAYKSSTGEDKVRAFIWVSQDGKTVKGRYTKTNSEIIGLPAWEKHTIGKKDIWDRSAAEDFIKNEINGVIAQIPKQEGVPTENTQEPETTNPKTEKPKTKVEPEVAEEDEDDDLPF